MEDDTTIVVTAILPNMILTSLEDTSEKPRTLDHLYLQTFRAYRIF